MKNIVLALAILILAPLSAGMRIQMQVVDTIREQDAHYSTQQSSFEFDFNGIDSRCAKLCIGHDYEIECTIISDDGKKVVFAVKAFKKNNKEEFELISDSVFSVVPGQNAWVRFGKKDAAGEVVEDRHVTFTVHRDVESDTNFVI